MTATCTDCRAKAELFRAFGNRCEACTIKYEVEGLAKRVEFKHLLTVGDYVSIRHENGSYGRIVAVIPMNAGKQWSPRQQHGDRYAKLRVRMNDGSFRDEHPEHLAEATPHMSELGQSLFQMMTGIGEAQVMQAEIDAFFSRGD